MDHTVVEVMRLLDEKMADRISLMDVKDVSNLASYFVIATANSDTHMAALRDEIVDFLGKNNVPVIYYDKGRGYDWMVIDSGYFIVHIFSERGRTFYSLEDLWLNAKKYSVEEVLPKN